MRDVGLILFFCSCSLAIACGDDDSRTGSDSGTSPSCAQERAQTGGEACPDGSEDCPTVGCTCGDGVIETRTCYNGACLGADEVCADACDPSEWLCEMSTCTPDCASKVCGDDDGCGGTCTACPDGGSCNGTVCEQACTPDCASKVCGDDDGCSGICTACPADQSCNTETKSCESSLGSCFLHRNTVGDVYSAMCRYESETACTQRIATGNPDMSEFVAGCETCSASCAPNWYDCAGATTCDAG